MKQILVLWVVGVLAACDDPFAATQVRAYKSVATGGEHSCAVATDGSAYCWGRGLDGELGNATKQNRITPVRVSGSVVFAEVTTGDSHSCGLATDGRAYCWGWNPFYQRGNPTDPRDAEPVPVTTELRFARISAGAHHTCALGVDSLVYCWGHNRYGQAGTGATNTVITPTPVEGSIQFVSVNSGAWHTCAITTAGAAYCWGRNDYGQLGTGSATTMSTLPEPVSGNVTFAQIDGGVTHTCAVARNQRLYCWGSNEYGELGDGGVFKPGLPAATVPQPVSSLFPTGTSISAGMSHTCATALSGVSRCWGRGLWGQLANGSTLDHSQPQPVHLQPEREHSTDRFLVTEFAAGGATHACALVDESVYCWGTGYAGQLGVQGTTSTTLPTRVAD